MFYGDFALLHPFTMSPLRHFRFPGSITSTCILFPTGEESVKKIVTDGKHVVRELGKSEVNFLKCTVTPSFYVINQKQDNCSVL